MHTFLFVGGLKDTRETSIQDQVDSWRVTPVDVIRLVKEDQHITIDQVRDFQKRLLLTPMQSPSTVGVIHEANLLTTEAQQALLKLLEEPPPHAYILCECETTDQLLPTIVSRCQVVRVSQAIESDEKQQSMTETVATLLAADTCDLLAAVDARTGDRGEAKLWVRELLSAARITLLTHYEKNEPSDTRKIVSLIRGLQKAQTQLSVNCNPKLVLDRVFLSL